MQTFKDADGREWTFRLTAWHCTKIREQYGVELYLTAGDDGKWDQSVLNLSLKPRRFLDIVWCLVSAEASKKTIDRESFEKAFDSDVYARVETAFDCEVVSFSPLPAALKADMIRALKGTGGEATDRPNGSTSNGSATSSAAPSGSTPGPSPGGN
jgi:hypothetical protein